jgi:hypothetical protein
MALVFLFGVMVIHIKVSGKTIISLDEESILGLMVAYL